MSPRLVALLLVASGVLAGCVSSTETPAATSAPAPTEALMVGTTGLYHVDGNTTVLGVEASFPVAVGGEYLLPESATEPSIGADKANNVYMTGFNPPYIQQEGQTRKMPTIWATFDHGATFKDVGPNVPGTQVSTHANTNDPIVYVDYDTGRVFMDDILPLSCGALSYSDDKGATWITNPYSCGNSNVNDHQTVGTAKPRMMPTVGYPNVVYRCVNNLALSECAMSYDGGLTFTPQVPVFDSQRDGCAGTTGHIRSGPDGKAYLPIATCPGGPKIMVTDNDGLTWSPIQIPVKHRASNHDLGFAVDEKNNMYAVWESGGFQWFSASTDGGKTWLPERNVTAPGVTATMFNTLAVGSPGHVAFAYLGSTIPGGYDGKGKGNAGLAGDLLGQPSLPEWDNATWNAYIGVMVDALSPNATIQSVTANDPMDPLARGLCGGTRCHGMNDFIEIAIDGDGRPWASFVDTCTGKCVTDPSVKSDTVLGMMATLRAGPALRGDKLLLAEIPAADTAHVHQDS